MVKLRDEQQNLANELKLKKKAFLPLPTGSGKTAIALEAVRDVDTVVIVTQAKIRDNKSWELEHEKFKHTNKIIVVSYHGVDKLLKLDNISALILDEAHNIKNPKAKRSKTIAKLAENAEYLFLLSATQHTNCPLELYSPLSMLGVMKLKHKAFLAEFARATFFKDNIPVSFEATKEGAEELELLFKENSVGYNQKAVGKGDLAEVDVHISGKSDHLGNNYVEERQLANGFIYTLANVSTIEDALLLGDATDKVVKAVKTPVVKAKNDKILEILKVHKQAIIYYSFKEELRRLVELLKDYRVGVSNTLGVVSKFNNKEIDIILTHPASLGVGVNLQHSKADCIIFYSPPPSLREYTQSIARLWRQGGANTVSVFRLIAIDTIEKGCYDMMSKKFISNSERERKIFETYKKRE